MLAKKAKVDRHVAQKILATGRNFHGVYMTLRTVKVLQGTSKFSFVVSKKVAAQATSRNKLKRRGFSAVERYYKNVRPNISALFFMKKAAVSASYVDIERDVRNLLLRAGLIS